MKRFATFLKETATLMFGVSYVLACARSQLMTLSCHLETPSESWIRVAMGPGDLLVLPAGIYHRFTPDENNRVQAMRLFKDEPKWIPYNRSVETDNSASRQDYLQSIGVAA